MTSSSWLVDPTTLCTSCSTWVLQSGPTSLLFPTLPYHIALLPTLFRILAFLVILPVILLTLIDIVGWTVFKLFLRPLGWAHTLRFKDPEPSLVKAEASSSSNNGGSSNIKVTRKPSKNEISTATLPPSSTSSFPSPLKDPSSPTSRSSSSSSSSSPVIRYTSSDESPSSSPPLSRSSSYSPPRSRSSSDPSSRQRRSRSASSGSIGMHRARAASIGVEGPLFGVEDVQSPLGSAKGDDDDDDEDEAFFASAGKREETSESDGEGKLRRRRGRERNPAVPRGGPSFGFTNVDG